MKWIAASGFLAIAVAACVTVLFVNALNPVNAEAFAHLTAWLMVPYVVMGAALALLRRKGAVAIHWHVVAIIVSVGGTLFSADVIFWHPDAQGAIAVLIAPLLQSAALALVLPVAWWIARRVRTQPG